MSYIHNFQRDLFHVGGINSAFTAFSTEATLANNIPCNGDPTVYPAVGTVKTDIGGETVTAGNFKGIACYLKPPLLDDTVYRFKVSGPGSEETLCFYGQGPLTPSGSDDVVTIANLYSFQNGNLDEAILVKALDPSDPDYGRPIAFGVAITAAVTLAAFSVSVQNLATATPQYSASTS